MEGFKTFTCERVLFHLSWLSKRVDTFLSLLWHDWQKWSWRDCYRSRQREENPCKRLWPSWMLFTGCALSKCQSATVVKPRCSSHCEQFIKYECVDSSLLFRGWWVSHNGIKMNYWGGAAPGSGKCACGMNKTCYDSTKPCNCNANIPDVMLEDSGLLTDKTALPVSQLRFGDTGGTGEQGWHTLGKLYCYGVS